MFSAETLQRKNASGEKFVINSCYRNPFTEASAGPYFVGRESQIQTFTINLNGLKAKNPNHLYLAGLHGTGKTSFLFKIIEIAKEGGFLGVISTLDADRSARDHISTILRAILKELHNLTRQETPFLEDWDKGKDSRLFYHPRSEQLETDSVRQDFETIANYMATAKVYGAIVCIDEGQRINPLSLSALKNSLQGISNYLIVLSLRLQEASGGLVKAGQVFLEGKARKAELDFGASRFFVDGIGLGPFDSNQEASECILKRLQGNIIQFSQDVIDVINRLSERIPREMISLASKVYLNAAKCNVHNVKKDFFDDVFKKEFRSEVEESMTLCGSISQGDQQALKGLAMLHESCDPEKLATFMYPLIPDDTKPILIRGIQGSLERVCLRSGMCIVRDDCFEIINPIFAYALELILTN
jgi:hypothetical protein